MLNYIKSEFYRIKQTRSSWILPGVLCLIVLAFNLMLVGFLKADPSFPYTTTKFSLGTLCDSCNVLMLLCVMITSQVFGGEYKNGTMKNVVSYGISKQ